MRNRHKSAFAAIFVLAVVAAGCKMPVGSRSDSANQPANQAFSNANQTSTADSSESGDVIASGTGVEKEKPAAGTGNVQGKALFNEQPAVGVEVKLCETFNQFLGGCTGQTFITKTDNAGAYLIKNVPPKTYEALVVKVFDTNFYVFATSGIIQSAKYKIEDGKTFFAPNTNLFKSDLKLLSPKAGSKIAPENIEISWAAYPNAAYYKLTINADSSSGAQSEYDFINKRVDGSTFTLDKPLAPGTYQPSVEAYNSNDIKLSKSSDDIKFTVTGAPAK